MRCLSCGKLFKHGQLVVQVKQILRGGKGLAVWDVLDNLVHLECPKK